MKDLQSIEQPDFNAQDASTLAAQQGKPKYGPFMLTMLILSTIYTSLSLISLISFAILGATFSSALFGNFTFDGSEFRGVLGIIMVITIINTLVSIAVLVLPWMKNKWGMVLKYVLMTISIIMTIVTATTGIEDKIVKDTTTPKLNSAICEDQTSLLYQPSNKLCKEDVGISSKSLRSSSSASKIASSIIGIMFTSGVGVLWYFAWMSEQKRDGKKGFLE